MLFSSSVKMTHLCCMCFEVSYHWPLFLWCFFPFQSATRATIAAASGQAKNVLDVSGWQSGERGWRAKTWRNKRTREVGPSVGDRRNSETKEDEHNATMIVVADCLSFRSSPLRPGWQYSLQTDVSISVDSQMCRFYYIGASVVLVSCESSTGTWLLLIFWCF